MPTSRNIEWQFLSNGLLTAALLLSMTQLKAFSSTSRSDGLLLSNLVGTVWVESSEFEVDTRPNFLFWRVSDSKSFPLDTRGGLGGVSGRVTSSSVALPGALVVILPVKYVTTTDTDGRFTITNVPSAAGYVLDISAAGYASRTITGVKVGSGVTDLGDLVLTPLSGGIRLARLDPEVNPTESKVEVGGTAYRYYRIWGVGGERTGGTRVELRREEGAVVPQSDDHTHDWAGSVPGVADADGVVRLILPSKFIGISHGDRASFDVLLSGQIVDHFSAHLMERTNVLVWRHKVGGGISGKVGIIKGGAKQAFETEVERVMSSGRAIEETITRAREFEVEAGPHLGAGVEIVAGAKTGVGVSGEVAANLETSFNFDPFTTSGRDNAMKLYVALADTLSMGMGPLAEAQRALASSVEPLFLDELRSAAGELRFGLRGEGNVSLGFKGSSRAVLGGSAQLEAEISGSIGAEYRYKEKMYGFSLGYNSSANASGFIGGSFGSTKNDPKFAWSLFDLGGDTSFRAKTLMPLKGGQPTRVEIEHTTSVERGTDVNIAEWLALDDLGVRQSAAREFTERLSFELPNPGAFSRLSLTAPIWGFIRSGGGEGFVLRAAQPAALVASVLSSSLNDGNPLEYEREVCATKVNDLELGFDLDLGLGLAAQIEGSIEKGVKIVNERGRVWRYKRMALESYPKLSVGDLPEQSILNLEAEWVRNAMSFLGDLWNEAVETIRDVGDTVVRTGNAVVEFTEGALEKGADVITRSFAPGSWAGKLTREAPVEPLDPFLPPLGVGNYVYGVGGVSQFETTNVLKKPVALTLTYTDAQVAGLVETNLALYRLDPANKRWAYIGGSVDTVANTVRASVTNLGTFALAPPLPTGQITLHEGGDNLPADGESIMTVTASNLVLNTGAPALEPWLFTVTASGLELMDPDVRPEREGVQIAATNATLRFTVRASVGGQEGRVSVRSAVGEATGECVIGLVDNAAPNPPGQVTLAAGQSRLAVSWVASPDADVVGYRVYYRAGQSGPPWDGTAAVEGSLSPVWTGTTNALLRGLEVNVSYHVAVAAFDSTGNESSATVAQPVVTKMGPPLPPAVVTLRFDAGLAELTWNRSEDDGFNDRDLAHYEVWRAALPGGQWIKVKELAPGSEAYLETAPVTTLGAFLRYGVTAVDRDGTSSPIASSNRFLPGGQAIDNDGDGMPDDWERLFGLNPEDPSDASADADDDGVSNLVEYREGTDPKPAPAPRFESIAFLPDGSCLLVLRASVGRAVTVEISADLLNWSVLTTVMEAEDTIEVIDRNASDAPYRYYRVVVVDR